jgi:hypothetical protein
MDPARAVGHRRARRRAARPRSTLVTLASTISAGAERSGRRDESVARRPVGRLELAVSVLVALAIGAGLLALWRRVGPGATFVAGLTGHGPDAAAWPRLFVLWLPAGHVLFAAVHVWLGRWDPDGRRRRHFLADQALSLALALLIAATLIGMRDHGALRNTLGAWYVLFVGAKTAVLLRATWRWMVAWSPGARHGAVALFLAALLPYVLLGAHVVTAMSSTSDEPYYLLIAHSLLHEQDLDLADNFARADYLPFYWGRLTVQTPGVRTTEDGRIYAEAFQGLQPMWLLPGYWLAGRAGAVVIVNIAGALALALTFRLALLSGASARAAFLAWLGAAFSLPVVSFAVSPWPEMTGACLAAAAVFSLLRAPGGRRAIAVAGGLLALMVATKTRLFLLAVPIMAGFVRRAGWRAFAALGALAGIACAVAVVYEGLTGMGPLGRRVRAGGLWSTLEWLLTWTVWAPTELRGHLGLVLDQEFGVLLSAPVLALSLAGAVVAARERRWRYVLLTAGPFLLAWYYLGAVALSRSRFDQHWHAGFSPPGRFVAAALPLLAVCGATMLDRLRTRFGWTVAAGLYASTLAQTLLVSIRPDWRFNRGVGRATPLADLFASTGLDAGRLLPSYVSPGHAWVAPGLVVLAAIALAGLLAARRVGAAPPRAAWVSGAAATAIPALALPAALWLWPAGDYPAAPARGRDGAPFHGIIQVDTGEGAAARERLVWAARRTGAIELAPRLQPGTYRIVVTAGAQGLPEGLAIRLALDGRGRAPVPMAAAAPPVWLERAYVAEIAWPGGRMPIRVEVAGISTTAPARLAYIRTIEVATLTRDADAAVRTASGRSR